MNRFIEPSDKSREIEAVIAFCNVSTLEQTRAIPRTINPATKNVPVSSNNMKNDAEGSAAVP